MIGIHLTRTFVVTAFLLASHSLPASSALVVEGDESADFSHYQTYAWGKGAPADKEPLQAQIVRSIDEQLQARGLTRVAV